uniref:Peptidase S1 domain-containing protein n=1 Tax=Anopheles minimus TaxID=112268 RepID=A0A182WF34_9DIPT
MYNIVKCLVLPLLILLDAIVSVQMESFLSTPPPGYNDRTSLSDCPKRFYSDVGDYQGGLGAFGGFRALRGEFQHMVAIGWTRGGGKIDYLCGGSLISNQFVLTAAHCNSDGNNIHPDTVRLGDTDLGSTEDDEFAQQIPIARMIVHPSYRGSRKYYDVALIELRQMAQFTEAVCSACLWQEKNLPDGAMDAVGFGATGFGEALSPTLQRVVLNHVRQEDCAKRISISKREMPQGLRTDQFCAASDSMDTCEGDSGGPIGVKLLDHRFGLLWNEQDSSLWECAATLIDYQYLITTASCVTTRKGHPKFVASKTNERAVISDVYVSPLYKAGRPENDIALLKMEQYVNYTVYRPACLWDRRTDGEWGFNPKFSAYGLQDSSGLFNDTVIVTARNGTGCEEQSMRGTDLQCFHNRLAMMPGVCWMDHGGPIIDKAFWGEPVSMYGIVSPLSKSCGSNLYMIDITPHIAWIEAIIVGRRDQYLVFSD